MVGRKVWWRQLCERHPMLPDMRPFPNPAVYRVHFLVLSLTLGADVSRVRRACNLPWWQWH